MNFDEFQALFEEEEFFQSLDDISKVFFYNLYMNKLRKQEKEFAKKSRKLQKRFFKLLKNLIEENVLNKNYLNATEENLKLIDKEIERNSHWEKLRVLTQSQKEILI